MSFLTLDYETYWAKDYTLSKMTTEEYVNDPRFEVIGVSVKVDDAPAQWFSGTHEETKQFLSQFDWADSACLAHNQMFDASILEWRFGIKPAFYYDTLCMARAMHVSTGQSNSLAALATFYNLGVKGDEIIYSINKRRTDFTPADLERYGAYCRNDTELAYKLFNRLSEFFIEPELKLIDLTLRMFLEPALMLDDALLVSRLEEIKAEKSDLLRGLMQLLKCNTEEEVRKKLASNLQFQSLLEAMGVDVPMKESLKTGRMAPAFAKTDVGFIALESHPDPNVQQLCAVRLGTKSTIEESRIQRFIEIGGRNHGMLPIPLKYYGAHTGRWSGDDKVNLQNLPSRNKDKKALKNSILAPPGHMILNADSAQIEARILAWLAGQDDVTEAFRFGRDVYCEDATKIFGRNITKADEHERFLGKQMRLSLGYGAGPAKFFKTLQAQPTDRHPTKEQCYQLVSAWRRLNNKIVELWLRGDGIMDFLIDGPNPNVGLVTTFGEHQCIKVTMYGLLLPNGMNIRYPNLRLSDPDPEFLFRKIRIHDTTEGSRKIWGGTVVENVVQALARIVIGEQMLRIAEQYKVCLTVHDSVAIVVVEDEAEEAGKFIQDVMATPPTWAPDLPLACEVKMGRSYGEC